MGRWPRDNQADLIRFYGDPGKGEVALQLTRVIPPFTMYYDGRPLTKGVSFHKKAAPALKAALDEIWEKSGRSQALLDREGISNCAGTYNPRKVRGSATKWSNHAYGAAIDLDAKDNGFGAGKGDLPQFVIDAFKRQGARWGGDYRGRTDPMHFEFCDAGPVQVAALGDFDMPPMDGDSDPAPEPGMNMEAPNVLHHDVPPDARLPGEKPPLLKRVWTWVSSGGVALGGFLYDYRIVVAIAGLLVLAALFALWLFGRQRIAEWVSAQVNG